MLLLYILNDVCGSHCISISIGLESMVLEDPVGKPTGCATIAGQNYEEMES
jgi:hypothetical protein